MVLEQFWAATLAGAELNELSVYTLKSIPGCPPQPRWAIEMPVVNLNRPRGVTVSTLDSESSDRGSNPREAFFWKIVDFVEFC